MRLTGLILLLSLLCVSIAQAATPAEKRQWFEDARTALNKHDLATVHRLKTKLKEYPLTPYLDIWAARKSLSRGSDQGVKKIIAQHADIPETINLRVAWLKHLAKKGNWSQISRHLEQYPADRARQPEIAMLVDWKRGQRKQALQLFSERWIKAKKINGYTHDLYQAWQKAGHPTLSERWLRLGHYARAGKWKKIKGEQRHLPKDQQAVISYWQKVQRHPEKMLAQWPEEIDALPAELILNDGLTRMARSDPGKAWAQLQRFADQALITTPHVEKLKQQIALRGAKQHRPEAINWFKTLAPSVQSEDTHAWLARLLIIEQRWSDVVTAIDHMPGKQRQQSNWLYWKARALEITGHNTLATPLYLLLANERGYYSFLAAERLGLPMKLESEAMQAPAVEIEKIASMRAIRRAYEWLRLGNANKASREWHYALQGASKERWSAAAALATHWGWYDQTIRAAFKADKLDALEARFPLGFESAVVSASQESGLTPSEIWSIIRQESAFNHQARSYVGAKGLMQLMPRTAAAVAKSLKMRTRHPDLFSPEINVRLGSTYLAQMKERFGSLALAAAAYNAGPHRVSTWLDRVSFDAPEAWVEAIPFNETRRYVQQVMAFVTVYQWRQSITPGSMIARISRTADEVSLNETP